MKKLLLTVCALGGLAALSPAPIYSKDAPSQIVPEESQSQRAAEQGFRNQQGVVGSVPLNTRTHSAHLSGKDDDEGTGILQRVQEDVKAQGTAPVDTLSVLRSAEGDVQSTKKSPVKAILWVLFAGSLGYGAFFALRRWMDKNLPEPKTIVDKGW